MSSLSYAITTHNEGDSIKKLIELLYKNKKECDEVVVLDDFSSDPTTITYLNKVPNLYKKKLEKNFASHKNYLNSLCKCDYIFQLDGDELPTINLLKFIRNVINYRNDIDLYWIPRNNQLYDIDMDYIKKWKWNIDQKSRINYPDYQGRVYKNNPNIYWHRSVHEIITGHKTQTILPKDSGVEILHHRHMDHQIRSNNFYNENF